jgi:hypothetical protein
MSGMSKSAASLQHDLISAPVQLVSSGREQFTVGMEHSGRRRALLRGEDWCRVKWLLLWT